MSTVFGRRWPRTEELAEESGQEKRKAQLHKDGVGSKAMRFITGDRVRLVAGLSPLAKTAEAQVLEKED